MLPSDTFCCMMGRMVNETDIVELELKSKRFSLSLKKKAALAEPVVQVCTAVLQQTASSTK